ncbi:MAG: hypothetical protein OEW75_03900, partial [Cyclobacteriaceae bacterium]|nr:hypothetical protein [Cyclobacteriaceae bacterium]
MMKAKELIIEVSKSIDDTWKPKSKGNAIWLERVVPGGIEYIAFNTVRTQKGFKINGVLSANKTFSEVEKLLLPLYKENDLGYLSRTIHFNSKRDDEYFHVDIVDIESLQEVLPWVKKKVDLELLPFFDTYRALRDVHKKIEVLAKGEVSSFVYAPPVLNVCAIKGVLKTPDFLEYRDWAISVYEEM